MKCRQLSTFIAIALGAAAAGSAGAAGTADDRPTLALVGWRSGDPARDAWRGRSAFAAGLSRAPNAPFQIEGAPGRAAAEREALARGRAAAERGRKAYGKLDFERSVRELRAARDAFRTGLASQTDGACIDVLLELGVASIDIGDAPSAEAAFREARWMGGPESLDGRRHPPKTVAAYRDAVAALASAPRASLSVRSHPPGAALFLDGHPVGDAPQLLDGLFVGRHVLRAEHGRGRSASAIVDLAAGTTGVVTLRTAPELPAEPIAIDAGATVDERFASLLDLGVAWDVDLIVAAGPVRFGADDRLATMVVDVRRGVLVENAAAPLHDGAAAERLGSELALRLARYRAGAPPIPASTVHLDEAASARR